MGVEVKLGKAMGVFDLVRGVCGGTLPAADPVEVARVVVEMRARLKAAPMPTKGM
jgi:hypothetical protein